jgi:hypothetical protein
LRTRSTYLGFIGFNFGSKPALSLAREWPVPQLAKERKPKPWPPVRTCQSVDGLDLNVVVSVNACPCFTVGFDYRYSFFTVPWLSPGVWGLTYGTVTLTQYDTTDESCTGTVLDEWTTSAGLSIGCNSLTGKFDAGISAPFVAPAPAFDGAILTATGIRLGSAGLNTNVCGGGVAGAGGGISIAI